MFNAVEYCLKQLVIAIALLMLMIQPSHAIVSTDVPEPSDGSYIVDLANVLDTDTEAEINMAIALLQKDKDKSIYLVTVPSITEPAIKQSFKVIPATSLSRRFLLLITYYLLLITYSSATKLNF